METEGKLEQIMDDCYEMLVEYERRLGNLKEKLNVNVNSVQNIQVYKQSDIFEEFGE